MSFLFGSSVWAINDKISQSASSAGVTRYSANFNVISTNRSLKSVTVGSTVIAPGQNADVDIDSNPNIFAMLINSYDPQNCQNHPGCSFFGGVWPWGRGCWKNFNFVGLPVTWCGDSQTVYGYIKVYASKPASFEGHVKEASNSFDAFKLNPLTTTVQIGNISTTGGKATFNISTNAGWPAGTDSKVSVNPDSKFGNILLVAGKHQINRNINQ